MTSPMPTIGWCRSDWQGSETVSPSHSGYSASSCLCYVIILKRNDSFNLFLKFIYLFLPASSFKISNSLANNSFRRYLNIHHIGQISWQVFTISSCFQDGPLYEQSWTISTRISLSFAPLNVSGRSTGPQFETGGVFGVRHPNIRIFGSVRNVSVRFL